MEFSRLFDKSIVPTEQTIASLVAQNYPVWDTIGNYILSMDKILVETKYFTKNYGWQGGFIRVLNQYATCFLRRALFPYLLYLDKKRLRQLKIVKIS